MKRANSNFNFTIVPPSALCTYVYRIVFAYGLRRKLGAQSDDDDVGPAAIAARSESGWSASGERGLSIPPALRTLISSRSRGEAEKRRGKVWDEDIKEKRAIYSPSFWAGDSQTRQWENKGTNSNFPSSSLKEF